MSSSCHLKGLVHLTCMSKADSHITLTQKWWHVPSEVEKKEFRRI